MNKFDFARQSRSKEEVLHFLNDPTLPTKICRILEGYASSLPTSGIIAGQAVSTAIDEILGLTDNLQYNDLDLFQSTVNADPTKLFYTRHKLGLLIGQYLIREGRSPSADTGALRTFRSLKVPYSADPVLHAFVNKVLDTHHDMRELNQRKTRDIGGLLRFARCFRYTKTPVHDPEYMAMYHACLNIVAEPLRGTSVQAPLNMISSEFTRQFGYQEAESMYGDPSIDEYCAPYGMARFEKLSIHSSYNVLGLNTQGFTQLVYTTPVNLTVIPDKLPKHRPGTLDYPHPTKTIQCVEVSPYAATSEEYAYGLVEHNSLQYGLGIVHAFDLNSVSVGVDIATQSMVYSERYIQFLMNRQLKPQSACTPMQTAVRMLNKAAQTPAFVNKEYALRYATLQLVTSLAHSQPQCSADQTPMDPQTHVNFVLQSIKDGTASINVRHPIIRSVISDKTYQLVQRYPELHDAFEYIPYRGSSYLPVPRSLCKEDAGVASVVISGAHDTPYRINMAIHELAHLAKTGKAAVKKRVEKFVQVMNNAPMSSVYSKLSERAHALIRHESTPFDLYLLDNTSANNIIQYLIHGEYQRVFVRGVIRAAEAYIQLHARLDAVHDKICQQEDLLAWAGQRPPNREHFGLDILLSLGDRYNFNNESDSHYAEIAKSIHAEFETSTIIAESSPILKQFKIEVKSSPDSKTVHNQASFYEWLPSIIAWAAETNWIAHILMKSGVYCSPFKPLPISALLSDVKIKCQQYIDNKDPAIVEMLPMAVQSVKTAKQTLQLLEDITVQELRTNIQLTKEGEDMDHCVGGYFKSVQRGDARIYQYISKAGHRATAEWRIAGESVVLAQLRAESNYEPHSTLQRMDRIIRELVNTLDVNTLWFSRVND